MPTTFRPYAALIVPRPGGVTPDKFLCGAKDVLATHDGASGTPPRVSVKHGAIQSDTLLFKVTVEVAPREGARVTFRLAARPGTPSPSTEVKAQILSDIVLKALALVDTRCIEWLQPQIRITPEEFRDSRSYVSPRRSRREMVDAPVSEADVDAIERNLSRMFADLTTAPDCEAPAEPQRGPRGYSTAPRRHVATAPADLATVVRIAPDETVQDDDAADMPDAVEPPRSGSIVMRLLRSVSRMHVRRASQGTATTSFGVTLYEHGMLSPILQLVGA